MQIKQQVLFRIVRDCRSRVVQAPYFAGPELLQAQQLALFGKRGSLQSVQIRNHLGDPCPVVYKGPGVNAATIRQRQTCSDLPCSHVKNDHFAGGIAGDP